MNKKFLYLGSTLPATVGILFFASLQYKQAHVPPAVSTLPTDFPENHTNLSSSACDINVVTTKLYPGYFSNATTTWQLEDVSMHSYSFMHPANMRMDPEMSNDFVCGTGQFSFVVDGYTAVTQSNVKEWANYVIGSSHMGASPYPLIRSLGKLTSKDFTH